MLPREVPGKAQDKVQAFFEKINGNKEINDKFKKLLLPTLSNKESHKEIMSFFSEVYGKRGYGIKDLEPFIAALTSGKIYYKNIQDVSNQYAPTLQIEFAYQMQITLSYLNGRIPTDSDPGPKKLYQVGKSHLSQKNYFAAFLLFYGSRSLPESRYETAHLYLHNRLPFMQNRLADVNHRHYVAILKELTEKKYVNAMFELADIYRLGKFSVKEDFSTAVSLLEEIIKIGDEEEKQEAQYTLGYYYYLKADIAKPGSPEEYQRCCEAQNNFIQAAKSGSPIAMIWSGRMYFAQEGKRLQNKNSVISTLQSEENFKAAHRYFQLAIQSGEKNDGQYFLGLIHLEGKSVQQDIKKAIELFVASDRCCGFYKVAEVYERGCKPIPQDLKMACIYYEKAFKKLQPKVICLRQDEKITAGNNTFSRGHLTLYATPEQKREMEDRLLAESENFQESSQSDIVQAKYSNGMICWEKAKQGELDQSKEAKKYLYEAARAGHINAQYQYGKFLMEIELWNDDDQGLIWLTTAARNDHPYAHHELGVFYFSQGDYQKALNHLKAAAGSRSFTFLITTEKTEIPPEYVPENNFKITTLFSNNRKRKTVPFSDSDPGHVLGPPGLKKTKLGEDNS